MNYLSTRKKTTPAFALPMIIFVFGFVLTVAIIVAQTAVASYTTARTDQRVLQAQLAADSGIDFAMTEINKDETWTGTSGEVEFHDNGTTKAAFEVVVQDGDTQDQKFITSTGRTYSSSGNLQSERTYRSEIVGSRTGSYSIVAGVGGLDMSNNSVITGGDIIVNGSINMSNSAQIGFSFDPVNLFVADQRCPQPVTSDYPRVCGAGEYDEDPVSMSGPSRIYGEVHANNQDDHQDQMVNPGLTESSGVDPSELPEYDREAHKNAVANTRTGEDAECGWGENTEIWEANTKIEGDVNLAGQCEVIVRGDVWITGSVTMRNSTKLQIGPGLTEAPAIMTDGEIFDMSNGAEVVPNDNGYGARIINFYSTASCSPDCSDVNGQELVDSQNHTAIIMNNSSSAPSTLLYARWAKVKVTNSGAIGALVGQRIDMTNKATVTFGTNTPGVGKVTWRPINYQRIFN